MVLMSGCQPEPAPTATSTPTVTESSTSPTPSPTPTDEEVVPVPEATGIVGPPRGGSMELGLADAKNASDWREGNFQVPGESEALTAMGATLYCRDTADLEFRFAKQSGDVVFKVAQDLDSDSSAVVFEFSLLANGRTVDSKQIAFDQSAELKAPLTGVSAVILRVGTTKDCSGRATALVTSATVRSS